MQEQLSRDAARRGGSAFYLGGHGQALVAGQRYWVEFTEDSLDFADLAGRMALKVRYNDALAVEVTGKGAQSTGGGVIGGGFGLGGALEGIAIAGVIDALASKVTYDTVLRVQTAASEIICAFQSATPRDLQVWLSPWRRSAQARSETGKKALGVSRAAIGVVEQIAQLGELHGRGFLSDEEFAAKKAELLAKI